MCTYSLERQVCPCVKGAECAQKDKGQVVLNGQPYHLVDSYHLIEALGVACEYQRRRYGRHVGPNPECPRTDPTHANARVLPGSFSKMSLACVRCVQTCAPPGEKAHAPGPDDKFERRDDGKDLIKT